MSNGSPHCLIPMHRRHHLLLLCGIAAFPAFAQTPEESPVQVVARFHSAFMKERWIALTAFLHPEELAKAQQAFLAHFSDENQLTRETVGALYGAGTTITKLKGMPPEDWINPILAAMNRSLDRSGLTVTSLEVLGSIEEGELRHVLYRWRSETSQMRLSQVEVRTLRRYRGSWRLLPPVELQTSLSGVQRALQK